MPFKDTVYVVYVRAKERFNVRPSPRPGAPEAAPADARRGGAAAGIHAKDFGRRRGLRQGAWMTQRWLDAVGRGLREAVGG